MIPYVISCDRCLIRLSVWALSAGLLAAPVATSAQQVTEEAADIRVIGHRDPEGLLPDQTDARAISAISTDFIVKQAPTLNAFQLVSLLPGANVASSDPYGLSTSSSLTLRGLGQDQIGVLLEGAPQNDIGYYYAYPSQFADTENLRQVALAQGAVDIDAPTVVGAGGLLSLTLDDPKGTHQALVDVGRLGQVQGSPQKVRGAFASQCKGEEAHGDGAAHDKGE